MTRGHVECGGADEWKGHMNNSSVPAADPGDDARRVGVNKSTDVYAMRRRKMVDRQILARGVRDPEVIAAMLEVPRHRFVSPELAQLAYDDRPLPIGSAQTISQPYIVALMTEALELGSEDRVLEIGTGSGYGAGVLSRIARQVFSVDRHKALVESARRRFEELGYDNVHLRHGDGSLGWPEHAPYDAIVVTAGGPDLPNPLIKQLVKGGRLVMPTGRSKRIQELVRIRLTDEDCYRRESLGPVSFVPLVGDEGWPESGQELV